MSNKEGYAQLRKGRHSEVGYVYHVVFSTLDRQPVFDDINRARALINLLKETELVGLSHTLSFVVMPDHIHWLFELRQGTTSSVVQRVKSFYTKFEGANIWNKGFYDHAIRDDESLQDVARYIVTNPFRAGLVQNIGDYAHWDAVWL